MEERYSRNVPAISAEEQAALAEKRVLIAGCGGLGGNLLEHLARLGVGHITAVDGDVFEASNLNRQLLSTPALLGYGKAAAARQRAGQVNPAVSVTAAAEFLTEERSGEVLAVLHKAVCIAVRTDIAGQDVLVPEYAQLTP